MNIAIEINTDNAAFEDGFAGTETARILHDIARTFENWPGSNSFSVGVRDINGNKVGMVSVIES